MPIQIAQIKDQVMVKPHSRIIAVDFDGTLVENEFPYIGEPKTKVVDYVKRLKRDGWKIILWTCRVHDKLDEAVEFVTQVLNIRLDAVNDNLPEIIARFGGNPRKIYADRYLDDKALNDKEVT